MKNTFGKGLESLIPKKRGEIKEQPFPAEKEAIFNIEIEKIKPNPYQPRKEFDQEGLNSLAESIREHGILQPLIVTRGEGNEGAPVGYQLIAGERRLLAAKMAGLIQVPVVIREPTEREKLEISLIENVQRLDLNPMEKAEAFKRLQEEFNFLQKDVAKLCGKSREAIANTLRLLELPNEIKNALKEGKITEGHAKAILMAKEPQRQKILFSKILKDGLNVRETESFVQKLEVWQPKKRTLEFIELFKDLEKKAKEILRIKTLKFGLQAGKPKLTIFFNSKKEIENFLKRFIS